MIVPLSPNYAKNKSRKRDTPNYDLLRPSIDERKHFLTAQMPYLSYSSHSECISDLLSEEGRSGREEERLRDRRLRRRGADGGDADRRGGGEEAVQQIPPAPGEERDHSKAGRENGRKIGALSLKQLKNIGTS